LDLSHLTISWATASRAAEGDAGASGEFRAVLAEELGHRALPTRPVAPITVALIVSPSVKPGQFQDVRSTMMARVRGRLVLVRQDASRMRHHPAVGSLGG
jgi:hypothetical protein